MTNHAACWTDNAILSAPLKPPATSWWLDVARNDWPAVIELQRLRMRQSKFGVPADPANVPARRQ